MQAYRRETNKLYKALAREIEYTAVSYGEKIMLLLTADLTRLPQCVLNELKQLYVSMLAL
ncbi:MAG: hypothetical protein H8E13_07195 [Actinobacteria bacterium]|nr:hypothetical protein [Actinomycetota bacterium]